MAQWYIGTMKLRCRYLVPNIESRQAGFYAWGPQPDAPTGLIYSADGLHWQQLGIAKLGGSQVGGVEYYAAWDLYVAISLDQATQVTYGLSFVTNTSIHKYQLPPTPHMVHRSCNALWAKALCSKERRTLYVIAKRINQRSSCPQSTT